ncbi:MAG: PAS domain S-box protein [Alphaproteobacteria bacterium]|nr:PAS domain S-box protein [Alphaproteobacteria bacterium]
MTKSNALEDSKTFTEKQLRSILDNTVDGMIVIDSGGIMLSYNRACEKLFGYSAQDALGQNVKMLMPHNYKVNHDGYISNYLHSNEPKIIGIGREVSGQRKDGTIFPMWLSIGEVTEEGKRYFVGIVRDITVQKNLEEQQQKYVRALEKSNRELDDFVYLISHDLKEPVRGIYSYSQFMREDYQDILDGEGLDKLESLMKMSRRMNDLIDSLLYFSRINKTELSYGETDIAATVNGVMEMLETYLKDNRAKIVIESDLPTVTCDQVRVGEIFRNLIVNGIKYNNKPEKEIHIGVCSHEAAPQNITFYVKDNGIGIPDKHYDSVFKMFKRLHGRDAYGGGTGAGLAIVKQIVVQHGGRIWIDSKVGEGATFYFTLCSDAG